MDNYLAKNLVRLKEITKDCREDMHEPDEQEVHAEFGPSTFTYPKSRIIGGTSRTVRTKLDNAVTGQPTKEHYTDMGIWISNSRTGAREWFNLANLIALARKAQ